MHKALTRPDSNEIDTAHVLRPFVVHAESDISKKWRRPQRRPTQRPNLAAEPFWRLTRPFGAICDAEVIEPMVSLDRDGRPLVELRACDAEQLGRRLAAAAYAAFEG